MLHKGDIYGIKESDFFVRIFQISDDNVIHVSIHNQLFEVLIHHLPVSEEKLIQSLGKRVETIEVDESDSNKLVEDWRSDNGGVWDIGLVEILNIVLG